jgi:cell division protein FtsL
MTQVKKAFVVLILTILLLLAVNIILFYKYVLNENVLEIEIRTFEPKREKVYV